MPSPFLSTPGIAKAVVAPLRLASSRRSCDNSAMTRAALIDVLRSYDAALRESGATGLFLFGSRATGQARADSDLDLFIDYDPAAKIPNLFRLMQIEEEIAQVLGIPVTITTREALHPQMKAGIERDAVRIM